MNPYLQADLDYLWHPFCHLPDWFREGKKIPVIERAEGVYLFDVEGRRYFDCNGSVWTNVHGHNHPTINAAVTQQLGQYAHSSMLGLSHKSAVELAKKLVEGYTKPYDLTRLFYADSGANAIEAAIRITLQYFSNLGQPHRCKIIAHRQSYHGDSLGAASLTGLDHFRSVVARYGFEVLFIESQSELTTIEEGENVAGIILEPLISGAAGVLPSEDGIEAAARAWCDEQGALLIFDEVFTGFGRTGEMFAMDKLQVRPDLLVVGKGLTAGYAPLSAVVCATKVFREFTAVESYEQSVLSGHTYAGYALGCAAAVASLEIFEQENTIGSIREMTQILEQGVSSLVHDYELLQSSACIGAAASIDLGCPTTARALCEHLMEHELFIRNIGGRILLVPSLSAREPELRFLFDRLREGLNSFAS